jgi:hypothetical protein
MKVRFTKSAREEFLQAIAFIFTADLDSIDSIVYNDTMETKMTIALFDSFLAEKHLRFEAVVIGGAALNLLGVVSRPTRDCDVLSPIVPESIRVAAVAFAQLRRSLGEALSDDWFNNGPGSLTRDLPAGWLERVVDLYQGEALTLQTLGRLDLLRSKLFALCDRGTDLNDCIGLAPTKAEFETMLPWLIERDANLDWPEHVKATVADLQLRLHHGI